MAHDNALPTRTAPPEHFGGGALVKVSLGLLALALAYRQASVQFDISPKGAEMLALIALGLLGFAILRVAKPGWQTAPAGVYVAPSEPVTAVVCGTLVAIILVPHVPGVAFGVAVLVFGALVYVASGLLHDASGRADERSRDPVPEVLMVTGFAQLGQAAWTLDASPIAGLLLWLTLPLGCVVLVRSALRFGGIATRLRPPLLSILTGLAGTLGTLAAMIRLTDLAQGLVVIGIGFAMALMLSGVRKALANPSRVGAIVFGLSQLATSCLTLGGAWAWPGLLALTLAAGVMAATLGRMLLVFAHGEPVRATGD